MGGAIQLNVAKESRLKGQKKKASPMGGEKRQTKREKKYVKEKSKRLTPYNKSKSNFQPGGGGQWSATEGTKRNKFVVSWGQSRRGRPTLDGPVLSFNRKGPREGSQPKKKGGNHKLGTKTPPFW